MAESPWIQAPAPPRTTESECGGGHCGPWVKTTGIPPQVAFPAVPWGSRGAVGCWDTGLGLVAADGRDVPGASELSPSRGSGELPPCLLQLQALVCLLVIASPVCPCPHVAFSPVGLLGKRDSRGGLGRAPLNSVTSAETRIPGEAAWVVWGSGPGRPSSPLEPLP